MHNIRFYFTRDSKTFKIIPKEHRHWHKELKGGVTVNLRFNECQFNSNINRIVLHKLLVHTTISYKNINNIVMVHFQTPILGQNKNNIIIIFEYIFFTTYFKYLY